MIDDEFKEQFKIMHDQIKLLKYDNKQLEDRIAELMKMHETAMYHISLNSDLIKEIDKLKGER